MAALRELVPRKSWVLADVLGAQRGHCTVHSMGTVRKQSVVLHEIEMHHYILLCCCTTGVVNWMSFLDASSSNLPNQSYNNRADCRAASQFNGAQRSACGPYHSDAVNGAVTFGHPGRQQAPKTYEHPGLSLGKCGVGNGTCKLNHPGC